MSKWENTFRTWAKPLSDTEDQKCKNAIKAITDAIAASPQLSKRNVKVFLQGSYKNNVNVRQESDVDVGVCCHESFMVTYPANTSDSNFGNVDASYQYLEFKEDLRKALHSHFGTRQIKEGNKAFDIKDNTYRVEADVVPLFEYRHYLADGRYLEGVALLPTTGSRIINWPYQHHQNGVKKNNDTGRRYKSLVRIFKRLCIEMESEGFNVASEIPGFLLECLLWNVDNSNMNAEDSLYTNVRECLNAAHSLVVEGSDNMWEVNELKLLFGSHQKWTDNNARIFLENAWRYVGF
jgi:hypothetical protein